eukprot:1149834-Pelagomonas_calceolata.AAC.2
MAASTERQGSMAAALGQGTEHTAQRHAGQAADPKLHTLFASTCKHLQLGHPITEDNKSEHTRSHSGNF